MSHPKVDFLLEMLDDMWLTDNWIHPMTLLMDGISVEDASVSIEGCLYSIEEQINHVAYWEEFGRRQLTGESLDDLHDLQTATWGKSPDWMPKWPESVSYYRNAREGIRKALQEMDPALLTETSDTDEISREARMYTRAIHASYHAGQLFLQRRMLYLPDPESELDDVSPENPSPTEGACQLLLDMMDSAWSSGFSIPPFDSFTKEWTEETADWYPREDLPSSTDMVNHMKFWEDYVCRRLTGESTEDLAAINAGKAPLVLSEWPQARDEMIEQHGKLRQALATFSDADLIDYNDAHGKPFDSANHTVQWLVQGIIVHHSYHMGQLMLMRQLAGDDV